MDFIPLLVWNESFSSLRPVVEVIKRKFPCGLHVFRRFWNACVVSNLWNEKWSDKTRQEDFVFIIHPREENITQWRWCKTITARSDNKPEKNKIINPVLLYTHNWKERRVEFTTFSSLLVLCEMQTASLRVRTGGTEYTSYNDNCNVTNFDPVAFIFYQLHVVLVTLVSTDLHKVTKTFFLHR